MSWMQGCRTVSAWLRLTQNVISAVRFIENRSTESPLKDISLASDVIRVSPNVDSDSPSSALPRATFAEGIRVKHSRVCKSPA